MSNYELWEQMAEPWQRRRELAWRWTGLVSEWLVERLDPEPGQTLLDLAAGTGETGFLAAGRLGEEGRLISSDFSPEMVRAAERVAEEEGVANAEFRVLDAERIDLDDMSVDGVLCRFGYMLVGDPLQALRETRRVLRPGGRLAFSTWGEAARNPWMTFSGGLMIERGLMEPFSSDGPGVFALPDAKTIVPLLDAAGFGEVAVEEMEMSFRFEEADELLDLRQRAAGPSRACDCKARRRRAAPRPSGDRGARRAVRSQRRLRASRSVDQRSGPTPVRSWRPPPGARPTHLPHARPIARRKSYESPRLHHRPDHNRRVCHHRGAELGGHVHDSPLGDAMNTHSKESLRERREAIVLEHVAAENRHDIDATLATFAHPRYEVNGVQSDGEAAVRDLLHELMTGLPDFHAEVQKIHHADDAVIAEALVTGTHGGEWAGIAPTGRRVEVAMVGIFEFEEDRLVCEKVFYDVATVVTQLGVLPAPTAA